VILLTIKLLNSGYSNSRVRVRACTQPKISPRIALNLGTFMFTKLLTKSLLAGTVLASVVFATAEANTRFQRLLYTPRQGSSIPQNTVGGAVRSADCASINGCPAALAPKGEVALTTSDRPTLFFYIPKMRETKASFQLLDKEVRVYKNLFTVNPLDGGIIRFALPSDAPVLEANKDYQWRLVVKDSAPLTGYIRRVSLNAGTEGQFKTKQPLELATAYAKQGIWLDMVTTLANSKTPEATTQIQELWKSINYEAIATKPLLECCKPSK